MPAPVLDAVHDAHRLGPVAGRVREQAVVIERRQRAGHALEPLAGGAVARLGVRRAKRGDQQCGSGDGSPHQRRLGGLSTFTRAMPGSVASAFDQTLRRPIGEAYWPWATRYPASRWLCAGVGLAPRRPAWSPPAAPPGPRHRCANCWPLSPSGRTSNTAASAALAATAVAAAGRHQRRRATTVPRLPRFPASAVLARRSPQLPARQSPRLASLAAGGAQRSRRPARSCRRFA